VLWVAPASLRGVPAERFTLRLAARAGGEQFQLAPQRPARALKKQFQALGVPPWERLGPLLWRGSDLLFVPGLGINARHWASDGVPQWVLSWEAVAT
jgi:tRNA(Ile)-lysidine synthase